MAESKIKRPLVRTIKHRPVSDFIVSSHDEFAEMELKSANSSTLTPSVVFGISKTGGINIYVDTGSGYSLIRTL